MTATCKTCGAVLPGKHSSSALDPTGIGDPGHAQPNPDVPTGELEQNCPECGLLHRPPLTHELHAILTAEFEKAMRCNDCIYGPYMPHGGIAQSIEALNAAQVQAAEARATGEHDEECVKRAESRGRIENLKHVLNRISKLPRRDTRPMGGYPVMYVADVENLLVKMRQNAEAARRRIQR